MSTAAIVPLERIESRIFLFRGQRVMLDVHLAELYGVETKTLNRAAKRNADRFPEDFMFQLTVVEVKALRCQIGTSNLGRGGRRYRPYVFTEQGVAMLSSVLHSKRAAQVNVQIMRTFVRFRQMLGSNVELAKRLAALEQKYDGQFSVVFKALRKLMAPPARPKREMGFHTALKEKS